MFRRLFVVVSLLSIICVGLVGLVNADIFCECESTAISAGGLLMACPAGDGPTLASIGATITVTLKSCSGLPIPNVHQDDFWIIGTGNLGSDYELCGGSQSIDADGQTDANGQTTISGSIAAGGYFGTGAYAVAQGVPIEWSDPCNNPLSLVIVSPDINADLVVDLVDLSLLADAYLTSGGVDPRMDFNGDDAVDVIELALMSQHYLHVC